MKASAIFIAVILGFTSATFAPAQTIGSLTVGSAAVTVGGYVSLYAKNVTKSGGSIAGVRFYRESNGTSGLQASSDTYVGMGVFAKSMWTFAVPTTGLSGSQTFYAVAYDTAGNSATASVTASLTGSGFANWSTLQPFLAKMPLSIGYVSSTPVINNGTTIYTGSLDTTITLDRMRADNGPNRTGDGALFSNNGNPPLPTNRGNVYEFTINPQTGCTPNWTTSQIAFPGPIRFMIDTSGDIFFTGDHYSTDLNLYIGGTPSVGSVTANPASATAGTAVTITASNVSETISPAPNKNANTGSNVLAAVCNVQFFLNTNGVAGLQTDTDRLLGCGTQSGSTWTLTNVSTTGLAAGAYTVYAVGYDPAGNTTTQTNTLTITVAAPVTTHFSVTTSANTITSDTLTNVTVQALDASNSVATNYVGTAHFTSSDSQAVLPANYTFVAGDHGVHTFTTVLKTLGSQTISVADTVNGSITGSATVTVNPPPTLRIVQLTNAVQLQWPTSAVSFTLQLSTNLFLTNSWSTVTNAPQTVATNYVVTNRISTGTDYYRLMK